MSFASLLAAGVVLTACWVARLFLGQWIPTLWAGIGLACALAIFAIVMDWRFLATFSTMRTTKHGLNMGVLIAIAVVGLGILNFLAVRYDKRWDFTAEGANSLAEESIKIAKGLKVPTEVVLLINRDQAEGDVRGQVETIVRMYRDQTKQIEFKSYAARKEPEIARKYDFRSGAYALFVAQGERHIKVDGLTEEALTKALLKLTRVKSKTVYYVTGHGERDFDAKTPEGMSGASGEFPGFKEELSELYEVKPLALAQAVSVPADAAAVAVIGPKQEYLESELQALRSYARKGGRLFIAIDPGERHNLQLLTKSLGIEFQNNFIIDMSARVVGGGHVAALGTAFSSSSEITRGLPSGSYVVFLEAAALKKASDAPGITVDEIVKTGPGTLAVDRIAETAKPQGQGPFVIAAYATGKLPAASSSEKSAATQADKMLNKNSAAKADAAVPAESKEFAALVVGDSDFLANQLFLKNENRDLALNGFAALTKDEDMISIRPKMPKGLSTPIMNNQLLIMILGFLLLPIALFATGARFWWVRRRA